MKYMILKTQSSFTFFFYNLTNTKSCFASKLSCTDKSYWTQSCVWNVWQAAFVDPTGAHIQCWAPSQYKHRLSRYMIAMLNIRRPRDRLAFTGKTTSLYIQTTPWTSTFTTQKDNNPRCRRCDKGCVVGFAILLYIDKIASLKRKLSVRLQRCNYWWHEEKDEHVHYLSLITS